MVCSSMHKWFGVYVIFMWLDVSVACVWFDEYVVLRFKCFNTCEWKKLNNMQIHSTVKQVTGCEAI